MAECDFFKTGKKWKCFGCEACCQFCPKQAIVMKADREGFRYPAVDGTKCIQCGLCEQVCPSKNMPKKYAGRELVFGGYAKDEFIRGKSTSGGAFSVIADAWGKADYPIFGAAAEGTEVYHTHVVNRSGLAQLRKSKYLQSRIGESYLRAKKFLLEGKKVLFSGTPCQIAGLENFLEDVERTNLLTVEVICEGVPSPLYIEKYNSWCLKRYGAQIREIDYRYKDGRRWDFQVMSVVTCGGREIKTDRWFNPFWSIWLNHLMSRPSCYQCPFTVSERTADITLGDLWGVHLYCPELYGRNGGSSLVICNSKKGAEAFSRAVPKMYGHRLDFEDALRYQSPLRKGIDKTPDRALFMKDLMSDMDYAALNKKWAKKPDLKLLWQKYVWGNRQKIAVWNLKNNRGRE